MTNDDSTGSFPDMVKQSATEAESKPAVGCSPPKFCPSSSRFSSYHTQRNPPITTRKSPPLSLCDPITPPFMMLPHWALNEHQRMTRVAYNAISTLAGWSEPRKLVTDYFASFASLLNMSIASC